MGASGDVGMDGHGEDKLVILAVEVVEVVLFLQSDFNRQ
jgi:hypothetical protein